MIRRMGCLHSKAHDGEPCAAGLWGGCCLWSSCRWPVSPLLSTESRGCRDGGTEIAQHVVTDTFPSTEYPWRKRTRAKASTAARSDQYRHRREGPRGDRRRPVAVARRYLHAVPDDAQFPLERHRADVTGLTHVHGAYTELWNAVDPIAERIRSLGVAAPGSYAQFNGLTTLKDAPGTPPRRWRWCGSGRRPRGGRAHRARHLSGADSATTSRPRTC